MNAVLTSDPRSFPLFTYIFIVVELVSCRKTVYCVIMTLTDGFGEISFNFVEEVPTAPWWKCKNS